LPSRHAATLLARNTILSFGILAFGIALLWLLVQRIGLPTIAAAAVAFVIASSVHYPFGRGWVFRGTDRHVASGFICFQINSVIGQVIKIALFAALIRWTPINYLAPCVVVSLFAGLSVFLLNVIRNFRWLYIGAQELA